MEVVSLGVQPQGLVREALGNGFEFQYILQVQVNINGLPLDEDEEPIFPDDGIEISIGTDTENALQQYNLAEGTITGGDFDFESVDTESDILTFTATQPEVTITFPVAPADNDPDTPPEFSTRFIVQESENYEVDPNSVDSPFSVSNIYDTFEDFPEEEPDTTDPDGEPDTTDPDGEPDTTDPDGEPDTTDPDGEPDTTDPDGEPDTTDPDGEPDTTDPDGETDLLETNVFRFQNSDVPGTYLFAFGEEAENVRNNFPSFDEEGIAFQVGIEPGDDLIPLYRFQSIDTPGTYVFVTEDERTTINADFSDSFDEEGLAFYVYGAGSGQGVTFNRFQNTSRPGTFLFASPDESASIEADFPEFNNEGAAFEVDLV